MEQTETPALENLCRVCLNYAENMTSLARTQDEPSNSQQENATPLTISQLLEKVMKIKIVADQRCPNSICGTCLEALKVCHDFQVLFTNSQACLRQYFNQNVIIKEEETNDNANRVDLIFGSNRFNLEDVVILEEQVDESADGIERLVGNLNEAVSLEIVNKSCKVESCGILKNVEIISGNDEDSDGKNGMNELNDEAAAAAAALPYQITIVTKNDINWNRSQCDLCPAAFSNKDKLMKHVSAQHCDNLRSDLCQDCAYAVASRKIKVPHQPLSSTFDSKLSRRCTNCQAFLKIDHSEKRSSYACDICDKTYTHGGSLKAHQEAVHNNNNNNERTKSYKNEKLCAVCGKSFARLSSLECHMRTHLDRQQDDDSKIGKSHESYRRHSTTHHATKARPYRCSICPKTFCSTGDKQRHELIHWNFRPFACVDCDASFATLYERRLHQMKTHRMKCQHCDAKFARDASTDDVLVHLKEVHGIETATGTAGKFACGDCDASFATLYDRRMHQMITRHQVHLKEVHGIETTTGTAGKA